jgi:hypothetical protein
MSGPPPPPSLGTLVWRDFLAALATRVAVAIWGFVLVFELIGRLGGAQAAAIHAYGSGNLLLIALAGNAVALPFLAWRLWSLRRVFADGVAVPGKVTEARSQQATWTVWVEYRFEGEIHEVRNAVKRPGEPPREGTPVTVVVHPAAPSRGLVAELYAAS